ncbi:MAG: nuclear transport factor 2 family protein [Candidatus Aminicenantes bacterium]|nr:MAG: nuclear transport factor 2 family protein [Candidatus Aminicenantes bacterium]
MVKEILVKPGKTGVVIMVLVLTGLLNGAGTPAPAEKEKVIAVVQQLLDVLETGDIQKGKHTVIPGAYLAAVHEENSENPVNYRTFDEFFYSLAQSKDRRKETMSGVKVIIHKKIALVRADYKLFLNSQLHHCGVNAFTLIKEKGAWKIVNVVYTFETRGCEKMNSAALPADEGAKKKNISVVQRFLDMLGTRDVSKADEILMPGGLSASWRQQEGEGEGEGVVKIRPFKELTDSLPGEKSKYKEVMTDPKVLIHKGIGVLCTGYKFYIDGKFSHGGIDIFSLIRAPGGWKIAGIVYTVEPLGEDSTSLYAAQIVGVGFHSFPGEAPMMTGRRRGNNSD